MRVAIFGDIHGNRIGLDAVLQHIERQGGVDAYWLLGDYCFGGPDPVGVLERLSTLPHAAFISGNADRYLVNPTLPLPDEIPQDRLDWLIEMTRDLYWTVGALSQNRWLDWLASLPPEQRFTLGDQRILLVHSYPGSDEDPGLKPTQSDEFVWGMFGSVEESLIFVGHTHQVQERHLDGKHIINPGCIGKPVGVETRASYAILTVQGTAYDVQLHYVPYNTEAVIQQLVDVGYPGAAYMEQFYRGKYVPEWQRNE